MSESTKQPALETLERKLEDLKARLPAHSIPPSMMMELDELEEQLEELRAKADQENPVE
jgi:hypothetical protein